MITGNQSTKLYPGLLCDAVEFFEADNGEFKAFNGGEVINFYETPYSYLQLIRENIDADPAAKAILMLMHPDSEMKQIEQYCRCNFSGLDYTPDIKDGVLQKGEYWPCPKRGICPGEGIVCKPLMYNGHVISSTEIQIIQKSISDKTNELIADELCLPMGTFHLFKKKLHEKLGVSTKQEITLIAISLNVIQVK